MWLIKLQQEYFPLSIIFPERSCLLIVIFNLFYDIEIMIMQFKSKALLINYDRQLV